MPGRFASGLALLLASAHFIHDVFTAFLAPILPLLGSWVDHTHRHRLFVATGPAGSGTLMSLVGLAPGYAVLAILLLTAERVRTFRHFVFLLPRSVPRG